MRYMIVFLILTLFAVSSQVLAQDDILTTEYNQVVQVTFENDGDQAFVQFTGSEGDVIYLLADFSDFVIGPELELDLRDSVGRSIGFKNDFSFKSFILAQLPTDGTYTAVVTYREPDEEKQVVNILVGSSDVLEEEPTIVTIDSDGFIALFAINVDQSGIYKITFERSEGDMATDFSIVNFSGFIPQRDLSVSGSKTRKWIAYVDLDSNSQYVAMLEPNIFRESGSDATVSIVMESDE